MTDEDVRHRAAIRALVTRYNIHGDRARFADLAACFVEDGTLEWSAGRGSGRAGIVAGLSGSGAARGAGDPSRPAITLVRHNITTMDIELDEDQAGGRGRIYFFVMSNTGPDHAGVYVDRYARIGDEWLIVHRQVRTEWRAATSVYGAGK